MIPDSAERESLQAAGLGEEKICFLEDGDSWEVNHTLEDKFPKLYGCGGYELLRCSEGGGKALQPIAMPRSGYTVKYLRAVVHHAKIYIRPLQRSLEVNESEQVMSIAAFCSFVVSIQLLILLCFRSLVDPL